MSIVKEQKNEQRTRRNSTTRRGPKRDGAAAEYPLTGVVMAEVVALCIHFALLGGAIRFGLTRDKGALAIGCYLGDDVGTEYIRPQEDVAKACTEIVAAWSPDSVRVHAEIRNSVYMGKYPA